MNKHACSIASGEGLFKQPHQISPRRQPEASSRPHTNSVCIEYFVLPSRQGFMSAMFTPYTLSTYTVYIYMLLRQA